MAAAASSAATIGGSAAPWRVGGSSLPPLSGGLGATTFPGPLHRPGPSPNASHLVPPAAPSAAHPTAPSFMGGLRPTAPVTQMGMPPFYGGGRLAMARRTSSGVAAANTSAAVSADRSECRDCGTGGSGKDAAQLKRVGSSSRVSPSEASFFIRCRRIENLFFHGDLVLA